MRNENQESNVEISILLFTYNHERHVRKALDSIIMQEINVPYEIIILDDASTDDTPKILWEYKKKHPEKIRLYIRKMNSGHPTKNGYFLFSKAKGNYFATIEGDDYWTDKQKIQKQYDFLEQHKEYSACMTDLTVVNEQGAEIEKEVYKKKDNHVYTLEDFRSLREPGMTITLFARNYFDKNAYRIIYQADKMMGDITNYMLMLLKGDIYQLDEKTAAYRYVCKAGESNFNSIHFSNKYRNYIQAGYWIRLENYMRQYQRGFEFLPMSSAIKNTARQYPIMPVLHLLMQSENRGKYLVQYFIYKFLLDSDYLLEKTEKCTGQNWREFLKRKRPLILFGAGAAAEEYIDKYAWKGNICFLADNSKKKQNTSIKGFMIKNPKEILNYKDKADILITNKSCEEEIQKQLRDMGIENYYCYCSMQTRRLRNKIARKLLGYYDKRAV